MSNNLIPVQDVQTMAIAVAKSGLFGMKTPEQALALMLVAQSEGLHPARAAMEYHVIQGRPALKADAMLARFQNAGGKVEWKEYTDTRVIGVFSHPQGGSISVEWSIAMADKAGLTKNPTWRQYPRQMLRARCISEGIRTVYPGVSVGVYTPEEVQDFAPQEKDVTPPPQPTSMPEKVKAAARGKSAPIEGEAKTVSGDPAEGDLSGIAPPPAKDAKAAQVVIGNVIHAFASKLGWTVEKLNAEFGKPTSEWTNADVDDAREMFKSFMEAKKLGADVSSAPNGGGL